MEGVRASEATAVWSRDNIIRFCSRSRKPSLPDDEFLSSCNTYPLITRSCRSSDDSATNLISPAGVLRVILARNIPSPLRLIQ